MRKDLILLGAALTSVLVLVAIVRAPALPVVIGATLAYTLFLWTQ